MCEMNAVQILFKLQKNLSRRRVKSSVNLIHFNFHFMIRQAGCYCWLVESAKCRGMAKIRGKVLLVASPQLPLPYETSGPV